MNPRNSNSGSFNTIALKDTSIVIGEPGKVFVIAEAGYNHEGNPSVAKELIRSAKCAGADAIKFQIIKADRFVPKNILRSRYEEATMREGDNLYTELKRAELSDQAYRDLMQLAKKERILFFSSFTEKETADFLCDLGVSLFKIASGEITNLPFIEYVARKGLPLILSTGMATLDEVHTAVNTIFKAGNQDICLLHSTTCYPAKPWDANLRAMQTLQKSFPNFPIGYSDHTLGFLAPVLAATLGASVIEKHFTLDKAKAGADHATSMEPAEFTEMVTMIRQVEIFMGSPEKAPCAAEEEMRKLARRSLIARQAMAKGETFTPEKIDLMRPAEGLDPSFWEKILGKKASCDLAEGEILTADKIEW